MINTDPVIFSGISSDVCDTDFLLQLSYQGSKYVKLSGLKHHLPKVEKRISLFS